MKDITNKEQEVSEEQFADLLSVSRDSAPGPDGIVHDAWTHSGEIGVDVLLKQEMLKEVTSPRSCRTSG